MKEHNNCSEASKSLVYARQDSLNMKGEFRSFYLSKLLLFLRSDFEKPYSDWFKEHCNSQLLYRSSLVVLPRTKVRNLIGKFL